MNKCDRSENQLFDSMIRFIKNGVLLVRDPHLAAKIAIIPIDNVKHTFCCFKMLLTRQCMRHCLVKSVMKLRYVCFTLSMEIITIFAAKWGSLTKRTPKMKLQQAFILEVQMINNLCFDANL